MTPMRVRKILVSVKFVSAILGPEMAAPILWTPGKNAFFLQENLHVCKIPRFRGGGVFWVWGGGGECRFYFYGRGDFSERGTEQNFWPSFRRRILLQYPAAPCSPGPFVYCRRPCDVVGNGRNIIMLFGEYCFRGENSVSPAANSVSSPWHAEKRLNRKFSPQNSVRAKNLTEFGV